MTVSAGPSVLHDNSLVMCLDAAHPRSYPGAGATWYDLSGNGRHVSLTSTTFSSAAQGTLVFNGSAYGTFSDAGLPSGTAACTMETWAYCTTDTGWEIIASYGTFSAGQTKTLGLYATGPNYVWSGAFSDIHVGGAAFNRWFHLVGTSVGSAQNVYVNGSYATSATNSWSGVLNTGRIGQQVNGIQNWYGNISVVKVYNRILTADEIATNYNVQKGRFGF